MLIIIAVIAAHGPRAAAAPRIAALALFKGMAVLSINGTRHTMREGQTSPEGVTLVHADSHGARIRVDGREHALSLDGRIVEASPADASPRMVRIVPGEDGQYFVDGQINGNAVRFLVDTGATSVAMNRATARRIGLNYLVDGVRSAIRTASGVAPAYTVTLDRVQVGTLNLRNVAGTVVDGAFPKETLLGQSFLNRLDLRRQGAVMELRER